jgi:hypothetical protein
MTPGSYAFASIDFSTFQTSIRRSSPPDAISVPV